MACCLICILVSGVSGCANGAKTTESTTTGPITTTSALSPNGLQLRVSVNVTSLTPGEVLQISLSEYNTLTTTNNVSAEKNWGVNGLTLGLAQISTVQPFGVAVFKGRYTAQNISQATPLRYFCQVACPMYIRLITGYVFLPNSINAASCLATIQTGTPMSADMTVNGIYTEGIQSNPLVPGPYTVVAGDEWGTLEFLYVSVE